jgi:hypothetical protein
MADSRPAKLRRLEAFRRRLPSVSASALEAILNDVVRYGVPEVHTRQALAEARNNVTSSDTPHGKIHQKITLSTVDGSHMQIEIAHPFAMMWYCFQNCITWRSVLLLKHSQRPSSIEHPWSLVIYTDEVTPGSGLTLMPGRKSQCVYYSLLEMGHDVLCREDSWFTATVVRSRTVLEAEGGMAQLVGASLKLLFAGDGVDFLQTGLLLVDDRGNSMRLHVRLTTLVQDGAAHKDIWKCRHSLRSLTKTRLIILDNVVSNVLFYLLNLLNAWFVNLVSSLPFCL